MTTEKYTRTGKGIQWIAADATDLAAINVIDSERGCIAYEVDNQTYYIATKVGSGATIWQALVSNLELLKLVGVTSAVNEITITNAATGANPSISCTGEADTGITFTNSEAEEILILDAVATAVNEITIKNSVTTAAPSLNATGGDTNISLKLVAKGTGVIDASTNGIRTLQAVTNVNDAVPTDAELDTAFGTPATVGRGFIGTVDDADADARMFICVASDAGWYWTLMTKAS